MYIVGWTTILLQADITSCSLQNIVNMMKSSEEIENTHTYFIFIEGKKITCTHFCWKKNVQFHFSLTDRKVLHRIRTASFVSYSITVWFAYLGAA